MENLNNVPSTGTFGGSVSKINSNFDLVVNAINSLEYQTTRSKGILNYGQNPATVFPNAVAGDWCMILSEGNVFPATIKTFNGSTWSGSGTWSPEGVDLTQYAQKSEMTTAIANSLAQATARMGYGECTVSGTSLEVSIPNFILPTSGGTIHIKMSAVGTGASTLSINGTTAKTLWYNGKAVSSTNTWESGEIISVFYDGTKYMASNSQGGGGKAEKINYDNSVSGLSATNVQSALDDTVIQIGELKDDLINTIVDTRIEQYKNNMGSKTSGSNLQMMWGNRHNVAGVVDGIYWKCHGSANSLSVYQAKSGYATLIKTFSKDSRWVDGTWVKLYFDSPVTIESGCYIGVYGFVYYGTTSGVGLQFYCKQDGSSWGTDSNVTIGFYSFYEENRVEKIEDDVNAISETLENKIDGQSENDSTWDFALADADGNIVFCIKDGHVITKNFKSSALTIGVSDLDKENCAYAVTDSNGNMAFVITEDGHLVTKNFNSRNVSTEQLAILERLANLVTKFNGKTMAVIGDSISTYSGYTPSGWRVYYPTGNVNNVVSTYWYQVATTLGMTPLNCAYSASYATGDSTQAEVSESHEQGECAGCSDVRIASLTRDGNTPDIVLILLGTNDYNAQKTLGSWTEHSAIPSEGTIGNFSSAYALMLHKIKTSLPNARIFCCTILQRNFSFPEKTISVKDYNDVIKKMAAIFGCDVIDTYACGISRYNIGSYSVDGGLHPNVAGHKLVADKIITELISKY